MKTWRALLSGLCGLVLMVGLTACRSGVTGPAGADGTDGGDGSDGADGTDGSGGTDGSDGDDGAQGGDFKVADFHGTDHMLTSGAYDPTGAAKEFVAVEITDVVVSGTGAVTLDFTVTDGESNPVAGVTGADFDIVKLVPAPTGVAYASWVSYLVREAEVTTTGEWSDPPWSTATGTITYQAYREASTSTFTDNGDGSYRYVFAINLLAAEQPDGTPITYDATLTHRASVMIGGSSGPTGDDTFDFRPDGAAVTETRDIVQTDACQACHGVEFHGHGGDRVTVETCVTCHNEGTTDPQSGETVDMKVMIHKIHAGAELATMAGADGEVFDDPDTVGDETDDNGHYVIWGYNNGRNDWSNVGFPAVLENCEKCHTGSGADVDNWKEKPSRAACGSCHDDIDWDTGTNHSAGLAASDTYCAACHPSSGDQAVDGVAPAPIPYVHDFAARNECNIPEFDVTLTISEPANGDYFVDGEAPVVTVVISENGTPIDHTTIIKDTNKEACTAARDGLFDHAYLYVHGPRARRVPVLTTSARAKILSTSTGPFDLSAATDLQLLVDGGRDVLTRTSSLTGTITVPVSSGTFADNTVATVAEMITWLNDDEDFAARAIAYDSSGKLAIRSRNLGLVFSIQLVDSDVATEVFGGDTAVYTIGGSTVAANIHQFTNPASNDPKATWNVGNIQYALDPVDDLEAGTYVVSAKVADRGRTSDTSYKTPSVAKITFQVGQADEELSPSGTCGSCHQNSTGEGLVFDEARHHKILDNTAIDQCAGCHDYQPRYATGTAWSGAIPIGRRVHAVHFGSSLNYPVATVGHDDEPVGRFWDITFPQDVRFCEACHAEETTSGTWATKAARIPCSGCHDSDAATAHMKLQTWDPTPADAWSGDEEESCQVCH